MVSIGNSPWPIASLCSASGQVKFRMRTIVVVCGGESPRRVRIVGPVQDDIGDLLSAAVCGEKSASAALTRRRFTRGCFTKPLRVHKGVSGKNSASGFYTYGAIRFCTRAAIIV